MTEEEALGQFPSQESWTAGGESWAAGPIANFILAIVIFTGLFTFFGKPSTTARVDKVEAGSAAAAAGFQMGDVVTAIDGTKIGSFSDMQRIVVAHAGDQLTFAIQRAIPRWNCANSGTQGSEGPVREYPSAGRDGNHPCDFARRSYDEKSILRPHSGLASGNLVRG